MSVLVVEVQTPVEDVFLASPEIPPPSPQPSRPGWVFKLLQQPAIVISSLTFLALMIQGYHPFADDGGIYVAGVEKVMDPRLFPVHAEYILPHLKHSLFSYIVGWLIRGLHVRLTDALFVTYLLSLWLMLYACFRLARLLFDSPRAQWSALLLLTATLTLPVAGTAIFFIDPYLTARSFSTPATLFAIAYVLERRKVAACLFLLAAFLLHPLMAAYAIGYAIALHLVRQGRWGYLLGLASATMIVGLIASHAGNLLGSSAAYRIAAASRTYFFLDHWAWFEIFGLFPPLIAAWIYLARRGFALHSNLNRISATSLYVGVVAMMFALVFARTPATFLLARLQPLRAFQLIYILFFLFLGGLLGQHVLRRRWWTWVLCFTAVSSVMFTAQMYEYPSLAHVEWPWSQPCNPWQKAFLWIRQNTPRDAFFALNPNYQAQPKEDTVGFRAMAQRSVLPDWAKDGGVAAIDPALAEQWWSQVEETQNFSNWTDRQRIQILAPLGVNWLVLPANASTRFDCPYQNSAVRVCRLPIEFARLSSGSSSTDDLVP